MTDKEIAQWIRSSRIYAAAALGETHSNESWYYAMTSVKIIHHIINSINWED